MARRCKSSYSGNCALDNENHRRIGVNYYATERGSDGGETLRVGNDAGYSGVDGLEVKKGARCGSGKVERGTVLVKH